MKPEGGVTQISIENALELLDERGLPDSVQLVNEGENTGEHVVFATWTNPDGADFTHKFTGFSWGYRGEGPHGLTAFFEQLGLSERIPDGVVFSLPQNMAGLILSIRRSGWKIEFSFDGAEKLHWNLKADIDE
jgi:hypothetical protein